MDWDLIKIVLAVQRGGTFASASQLLKMDESTVRRKLGVVEQFIGAQLFERRNGRLELVERHAPLVGLATSIEAQVVRFINQAKETRLAGAVRVSLIDLFGIEFSQDIAGFCLENPEIELDITTEPHIVDLVRDGVDIAIRTARPTKGGHKIRKFGQVRFGAYCTQEYLERYVSEGEAGHRIIALSVHYPHSDHEFELAEDTLIPDLTDVGSIVAQTDCYPVMARLCEQGVGIAVLPHFYARQSAKLIPVQDIDLHMEVDVWCVIRQEFSDLPKIRRVVQFLDETVKKHLTGPDY